MKKYYIVDYSVNDYNGLFELENEEIFKFFEKKVEGNDLKNITIENRNGTSFDIQLDDLSIGFKKLTKEEYDLIKDDEFDDEFAILGLLHELEDEDEDEDEE